MTPGKKGKAKRNKLLLFTGTLSTVLACGAVVLFLMKTDADGKSEAEEPVQRWEQLTNNSAEVTEENEMGDAGEDTSRYGDLISDPQRMEEENVHVRDAASEDEVTLLFAGDILFDDGYSPMVHLKSRNLGISGVISGDLLELMKSADVFMLNNEFPYSDRGTPLENKQFTFCADPENALLLTDMGVDVVSLANNHAYDYGEEALSDTFATLRQLHIPYVGAGKDIEEASDAVFFVVNDYKIGILAATQIERLDHPDTRSATQTTPGVFRCWNVDALLEQIAKVRQQCDYLVVYVHWGTENEAQTDWAQEKQATQIAQAGADLIVGDHTHCLQRIEVIDGVPVIYSLGNFWFNSKDLDAGLLKVTIAMNEDHTAQIQFIPTRQQGCETFLATGSEKERILSYMRSLSAGIQLDGEGFLIP